MFVFSNLKWIFDIEIWRKHAGKHISLEFLNFNIDFIYNNLHNIWRIHSSQNPDVLCCRSAVCCAAGSRSGAGCGWATGSSRSTGRAWWPCRTRGSSTSSPPPWARSVTSSPDGQSLETLLSLMTRPHLIAPQYHEKASFCWKFLPKSSAHNDQKI